MAAAAAAYFDEEDHDSSEIAILSDGKDKTLIPRKTPNIARAPGARSFFSSSKFKKFEYKHLKNTMTKVMLHSFIL
jgi:hypothetical protein